MPGRQVHSKYCPTTEQIPLTPHGLGTQGCAGVVGDKGGSVEITGRDDVISGRGLVVVVRRHWIYGSPSYPLGHVHMGL